MELNQKTTIRLSKDQRYAIDAVAREMAVRIGQTVYGYNIIQAVVGLALNVAPTDPRSTLVMAHLHANQKGK